MNPESPQRGGVPAVPYGPILLQTPDGVPEGALTSEAPAGVSVPGGSGGDVLFGDNFMHEQRQALASILTM